MNVLSSFYHIFNLKLIPKKVDLALLILQLSPLFTIICRCSCLPSFSLITTMSPPVPSPSTVVQYVKVTCHLSFTGTTKQLYIFSPKVPWASFSLFPPLFLCETLLSFSLLLILFLYHCSSSFTIGTRCCV